MVFWSDSASLFAIRFSTPSSFVPDFLGDADQNRTLQTLPQSALVHLFGNVERFRGLNLDHFSVRYRNFKLSSARVTQTETIAERFVGLKKEDFVKKIFDFTFF